MQRKKNYYVTKKKKKKKLRILRIFLLFSSENIDLGNTQPPKHIFFGFFFPQTDHVTRIFMSPLKKT